MLVVFSKKTGERRRVVDADSDAEYDHHVKLVHPGEDYMFLSHAEYDTIGTRYDEYPGTHGLNHHVALHAGFERAPKPHETIHAIIDPTGLVVNTVHADPECGDCGGHYAPEHKLVPCGAGVGIGHRHVDGVFVLSEEQ